MLDYILLFSVYLVAEQPSQCSRLDIFDAAHVNNSETRGYASNQAATWHATQFLLQIHTTTSAVIKLSVVVRAPAIYYVEP
jgi:hypothetical protein